MSAPTNTQIVAAAYDALNQHDTARLALYLADDIHLESTAFGLAIDGPAAVQQFLGGFVTAFPDFVLTTVRQHVTEDGVVTEVAWSGTHNGPLMSPSGAIPPTGKRVENTRMCEIFRMRNGKIIEIVNYHDVATWMRQLGLI
jgi:steroid delta-isomerase-like uncharacterized protein